MLFSDHRGVTSFYERLLFEGLTLDQVLDTSSQFPVSGIADLRQSLLITEEYFSNLARLHVKELDQKSQTFDRVWIENNGAKSYSRIFQMPIFAKQEKPIRKRDEAGETTEKPLTLNFSTIVLYRFDYFPSIGDLVYFRDTMYELTNIYLDPADYFQQTAFPLYVRAETRISNQDSKNFGSPCESKFASRPPGLPASGLPQSGSSAIMP